MDNHTPEQRHKNMQAVKNKDSKIEQLLRKELWARGLRYRKNCSKVFGHPDIVFISKKIAVFCDSGPHAKIISLYFLYLFLSIKIKSPSISNIKATITNNPFPLYK